MRCPEVQELLPAYADDRHADLSVRRHLASCDECRQALDDYEQVLDGLSAMRSIVAPVPVALRDSLVAIARAEKRLDKMVTHVTRNRRAYAGGIAAVAVGAAGAALWRSRRVRTAAA
ncbi:MAG TPA: hypothetical protein VFK89_02445 [Actinomycetota bacterium]|nr:hypothetical protein [Actinomycetota bacterium]